MRKLPIIFIVVVFLHSFSFLQAQIEEINKSPVANIEISPVSKSDMVAPLWLKFYPVNTYDPDGTIVLFKMDMNGDGVFDVNEKSLRGSSSYFEKPGSYTAIIQVTDNDGAVTQKTQEFIIREFEEQMVEKTDVEDALEMEDIPEKEWEETDISWIQVWNPWGGKIVTKEIDSAQVAINDFKSISPIISIEPEEAEKAVGAIRIELPGDIELSHEDRSKVVLAFYEESFAVSTGQTEARWRYHTLDYDEGTESYFAEMNHGCIVTFGVPLLISGVTYLVWDDATRLLLSKKSSSNFVLYYSKKEISEAQAKNTLEILEKARSFLKNSVAAGGLGLNYPLVPAKIDVYYVDISAGKDEDVYGLYRHGKTGARWLDLNNPSNFKSYDTKELEAIIVHELFHIVQYSKYNHSDYKWLNEALSTAAERSFVKSTTFEPDGQSPISNNNMYISGLKKMKSDKDGYSAGLFIHYLENRFGKEIYSNILNESKRQIAASTSPDAFIALSRAITRLARKKYPTKNDWQDLDFVWQDFSNHFIEDEHKPSLIDKRVNYRYVFNETQKIEIAIGEDQVVKNWKIKIPNLSLHSRASRLIQIKAQKWNDEDKAMIDCSIKQSPQANPLFDISTRIDFFHSHGKKGYVPDDARFVGKLNSTNAEQSFSLQLEKKNRYNLLSVIPIGLGAKSKKGFTEASYTLSCKIRTEDKMDLDPDVPISTSAIDNYWWTYWKAAIMFKKKTKDKSEGDIKGELGLQDMFRIAASEWKPIKNELKSISTQKNNIDKKLRAVQNIQYKYFNQRHEFADSINALIASKKITPEEFELASKKLKALTLPNDMTSKLQEISDNYISLHNVCSDALGATGAFSSLKTIGSKGEVLPNRSFNMARVHSKELPTENEIEKALKYFHQCIANIAPAKQALIDFEKYWKTNEKEANEIIDEIKKLFPNIK